MDSMDEDMFDLSDDETTLNDYKTNPVEEHLIKQFNDVHDRVEKTKNEITEVQETSRRLLNELLSRVTYVDDVSSDSDSDAYTVKGEPTVKRKKCDIRGKVQPLTVVNRWQRIIDDKWIIGVVLQNTLKRTLDNLRFYIQIKDKSDLYGTSAFWYLKDESFWYKIDTIESYHDLIVATVVLDVPSFEHDTSVETLGTISYEIDEKDFQTAVPSSQLTPEDAVNEESWLKFSSEPEFTVLALKAISVERILRIPLRNNASVHLLRFLKEKSFRELPTLADVYVVRSACSLMFAIAEILPILNNEARIKVSTRSITQLKILLHLLQHEFPDASIEEEYDKSTVAATALMEELQMYLDDKNPAEIQRARMKTDLLIRE